MISKLIIKLKDGANLTSAEIDTVMNDIFAGKTTEEDNIQFLTNLTEKGESDEEILGILDNMQRHAIKIVPKNQGTVIDMCGTGGDKLQTFNVSTTASFVVAAAGGIVAKHGNRSSTGISGSADIFEYFGYDLNQEPSRITNVLEKHKICFLFAQKFHPAMKYLATARKKISKRTVFNLLGPISNPANVKDQLIGVSSIEYLERLPLLLKQRGAQNIMTVRGDNGLDEFSTNSINRICMLKNGKILTNAIDPEVLGLHKSTIKDIQIENKDQAVRAFVNILNNTANQAMTETTILNAAAGLIVGNIAKNFDDGIEIARNTIESGAAFKKLSEFVKDTGNISKLEEIIE